MAVLVACFAHVKTAPGFLGCQGRGYTLEYEGGWTDTVVLLRIYLDPCLSIFDGPA